ncbi:stage V sporulation protein AC [Caldalkalibacillus uzonensis]|uniref:Stage V sporulation protein AC n=1 Tax=Caldalkalibacillus uzonensis TaxID=353224 RepID=A0ABU0CMF8_9BACI|nr:stage V sporulation protein AC [Caldalkalibacillus uzonensis]MDQ0337589.1 stage V sporulation protein AC [Caldalkalibacillus uzonensis]
MSDKKKKTLTPTQKEYQLFAKVREPKRPLLMNCLRAFLAGGAICALGQAITLFYTTFFDFTERKAGDPTVATLILIAALLTGFGVYDRIAQWAGAGTAVPVTGFANAIASAAIEHRSEGFVLGVGSNMFKLAGPVIVFGVVAAFFIGIIHYLITNLGG